MPASGEQSLGRSELTALVSLSPVQVAQLYLKVPTFADLVKT
jgi:hypothetical protein